MKRPLLIRYGVLVAILIGAAGAFYYVRSSPSLQFTVGIVTAVAYVLWGIVHHALEKDLHQRVVVEYILIGAIAIVLLATVLKT